MAADVGEIALAWWRETISDSEHDRRAGKPRDTAMRAELKRCAEPTEVFFCPAYHDLVRGLEAWGARRRATVAVIAGVLAHVKRHEASESFARQMARHKSREKAVVAASRFRRLIRTENREDLFMPLVRVVRLLDGVVNVADLAESIFFWGDPRRRDWACAYYETAPEKER
jgi:CRISPR system Cascade subunit CasB